MNHLPNHGRQLLQRLCSPCIHGCTTEVKSSLSLQTLKVKPLSWSHSDTTCHRRGWLGCHRNTGVPLEETSHLQRSRSWMSTQSPGPLCTPVHEDPTPSDRSCWEPPRPAAGRPAAEGIVHSSWSYAPISGYLSAEESMCTHDMIYHFPTIASSYVKRRQSLEGLLCPLRFLLIQHL